MQSATEKKFAAIEEKIAALKVLGKKMERMEKDLAGLIKRVWNGPVPRTCIM